MSEPPPSISHAPRDLLPIALIIPAAWIVASFFPDTRLWGINFFGFFSGAVFIALGVVTIAALAAIRVLAAKDPVTDTVPSQNPWRAFAALAPIASIALFWFFRTRTHFLGDGYQILSQLTGATPYIKPTETVEAFLHLAVRSFFGDTSAAVLSSYRLLSIAGGALYVLTAIFAAARLVERPVDRMLFVLGLVTGGYGLLFFGYVENYTIFVLAVFWFCLAGLFAAQGRCNRFWILVPLGVTLALHVIGAALIPAAVYLLIVDSPLARLRRTAWIILGAAVLVAGGVLFVYLYRTNLFFRYAFVPLVPIEVTAEHYTLFSWRHLLDYANLRLLIVPAAPVVLITLWSLVRSLKTAGRDLRFLLISVVSATIVTFVLDPKLGMPRDWDLFSFAAVPALLLFLTFTLSGKLISAARRRAVIYTIILGAVALGGRVAIQLSPTTAIDRLWTYIGLDHARNRATYQVLRDYYIEEDEPSRADKIEARYQRDYPEAALGVRAESLARSGQPDSAIALAEQAIRIDPIYWAGYSGLGYALIQKENYDSALTVLRIANGLNPNNPIVVHNLGYAWLWAGRRDKAETLWKRAYQLDTNQTQSLIYLARLYRQENRLKDYAATLEKIAAKKNAPLKSLLELADLDCSENRFTDAAVLYKRARAAGLDENLIRQRLDRYPQLKNYMADVEAPDSSDVY